MIYIYYGLSIFFNYTTPNMYDYHANNTHCTRIDD